MYNKESIIKKFKSIHGDKYDYSKVVYVKATEKVQIICPKHGEFFQEPSVHIKGRGCPICGIEAMSKAKTYTLENFINKANIIHNKKYSYEKTVYNGNKQDVIITCPIHGDFTITPNAHIQGRGCPVCGNSRKGSPNIKHELYKYIKTLIHDEVIYNDISILKGENIDVVIPSLKIGFCINTLKQDIEKYNNKKRRLNKTHECKKQGIRLIHIFEDEWKNKNDICKSRIDNILGFSKKIYARKCKVVEINKTIGKNFFNENHIQGNVNFKIAYGLEFNGEIISIMSFGGFRKNMGRKVCDNSFELLRFCNKKGVTVVGGASKLFKYFIENINPSIVISYADIRWSNGGLYEKLNFRFIHDSEPSYFYLVEGKRKSRFGFRKDILISKYDCEKNKTEYEFCTEKGWYRIYDCGTKLYEWKNPTQ